MKTTFYLLIVFIFSTIASLAQDTGLITDIDGNTYKTVKIGEQIWMAGNLGVKHYNNGDSVFTTTNSDTDITNESEPEYQWFYAGDEKNGSDYGRLYTLYVIADERNICPSGWHVPSKDEWKILVESQGTIEMENNTVGIASKSGDKLKEPGNAHWKAPASKASNKSGFTALPGGSRLSNGKFYHIGTTGNYWSSSIDKNGYWVFRISNDTGQVYWYKESISGIAYSIRCLKD